MAERRGPLVRLGLLVAAVGLLASACSGASADPDTDVDAGYQKAITHAPYVVDAAPLTDTDGKPYSLVDDTDKPLTLVFFGYTHCPDICPTTLDAISQTLKALGPGKPVRALFITLDPERDTPAVMKDYVSSFDPRVVGLTGSQAEVDKVAREYRVYAKKVPTGDGGYSVDHTGVVYGRRRVRHRHDRPEPSGSGGGEPGG